MKNFWKFVKERMLIKYANHPWWWYDPLPNLQEEEEEVELIISSNTALFKRILKLDNNKQ